MRTCRSLVHRSPLHSSLLPRHRDDMRRRGLLYQQTTHNRLGTPSASDVIAKNGAYFSASSRSNIRIVNPTVQTATNRELQHACEHYVNTAPEGNIDYALSVVGMTVLEAQAIPGNGCDSNSRASEIFYSMDRGSTWTQLAWCTFTTGSFCAERHIKRHVRHPHLRCAGVGHRQAALQDLRDDRVRTVSWLVLDVHRADRAHVVFCSRLRLGA